MKRRYRGWIYRDHEAGVADRFYVTYTQEDGDRKTALMGCGAEGAAESVEFFDKLVGQPIKLEATPLGYRVYIEEACDPDITSVMRRLTESEQIADAEAYERNTNTRSEEE